MSEANLNQPGIAAAVHTGRSIGCGFWLTWLFATVVGSGIGWLAGWWVSFQVPGELGTFSLGLVNGLVLGLAQWLVLRSILPAASWWIWSSALGWGIGFLGGAFLATQLSLVELGFSLALGAVIGLCTGLAQWLVLRRISAYAGWWVLASLFSWTSAFLYYQGGLSLRGAFFGLLVGILSGWALVGILNFPGKKKI
jgi:hypothetical protein